MSSFVFYRFKSQKEPSRISFDGTGISVWQLKHEIILENKMGKGNDFDFAIYNADTEEEYTVDHFIIPRSTSVLARRLPPARPGRGNAQSYMVTSGSAASAAPSTSSGGGSSGGNNNWKAGSMSKRFDGKEDDRFRNGATPAIQEPINVIAPAEATGDEASALAAMFAQTSQQWQQTQEQMANATHVPFNRPRPRPAPALHSASSSTTNTNSVTFSAPGASAQAPGGEAPAAPVTGSARPAYQHRDRDGNPQAHKPPPLGYICYRCGQKGHWIQECPTNDDRAYDDRPKIKRTTGIPKSFLTTVEGPGEAGTTGVMVTAEGGFVIARPDNASWLAHRALTKNLSAKDVQNLAPTDPDLTCPICSRLLRDATLTPCCSTSFCEDCLHNALADNDMLCPDCESRIKNLGKLVADEGRRERVNKYIEEVVEASKEIKEEGEESEGDGEANVEEKEPEEELFTPVVPAEMPVVADPPTSAPGPAPPSKEATPGIEREPSGTPLPSDASPVTPTPTPAPRPILQPTQPVPLNAQQQAQVLRQQQLQQQRAMALAQGGGYGMMGMPMGMGMSPHVLQQQMYQLQMTLQNPTLHPQMRMNLQLQLQQVQMMAMQMGLVPGPGGRRMDGAVAAAYGGNFARPAGAPVGPRAVVAGVNGTSAHVIPTGPKGSAAAVLPATEGVDAFGRMKRTRPEEPEDLADVAPLKKRAASTEVKAGGE